MEVLLDFSRLYDILDGMQLSSKPDTFAWCLIADQKYSMASAYGAMFIGSSRLIGAKRDLEDIGTSASQILFLVGNA